MCVCALFVRVNRLKKKADFLQNIQENSDLGSALVGGAICIANFGEGVAQKLHGIILFHFGLVLFRFHFAEVRQVIICMICGRSGRVHDLQNIFSKLNKLQLYP